MTTELIEVAAEDVATLLYQLPGPDHVGKTDSWQLISDGKLLIVHAKLLGMSSSHRSYQHRTVHPDKDFATGDQRCAACRWFEPRIFREVADKKRFLVHRTGVSIVPGELTRTRHEFLGTGHEVVESLTLRRRDTRRPPSKCPVCDGTGLVSRPSGIAGDAKTWTSNRPGPFPCRSCNGSGVLYPEDAFLTGPAARVLAQAAGHDDDLDLAYVNRAVV
jgi:hypothetical protein